MKTLCIIPARGGSKGIPKKNIKKLDGKPMIGYTIEAALESDVFDKVIVSTDDEEIAQVSSKFGAEIPFLRPKELATDTSSTMDAIIHAINWFEEHGQVYESIVILQPTSPLRDGEDIRKAMDIYYSNNIDTVVSVCESKNHPYLNMKVEEDSLIPFFQNINLKGVRRQDFPKAYQLNGAIYIGKSSIIKERNTIYGNETLPYIMDEIKSTDVDTLLDFKFCELILGGKLSD